jgi:signal transduction histidine kinase
VSNELDTGVFMMDLNLSYLEAIGVSKRRYLYGIVISTLLFLLVLLFSLYMSRQFARSQQEKEKNEKLALMGRMSASIAHEIKNPLGIIKSSAQLIEKKYSDKKDEAFSYIYEEIDRLNQNINNYLSFSRDITVQPQPVNLEEHIKSVLKNFPEVAFSSGNTGTVSYDPFRLTQLLRNLIINAQNHGGGKVSISTTTEKGGVSLQVCDEGPGIPQDQMEEIFEPFHTSSPSGTGLGLSICRRIAELHGGRIHAENRAQGGACFTLTIGSAS